MKSNATTVDEYPADLPDDRRDLQVIGDAIAAKPQGDVSGSGSVPEQ